MESRVRRSRRLRSLPCFLVTVFGGDGAAAATAAASGAAASAATAAAADSAAGRFDGGGAAASALALAARTKLRKRTHRARDNQQERNATIS